MSQLHWSWKAKHNEGCTNSRSETRTLRLRPQHAHTLMQNLTFAESHLCWCFKLTCQGVEVAGVPFSYTPCSRTSSLWQLGSSSSLNCRARFTTGMCWPPCGPRPLPHKQKEAKLNPRRLCRAQTGSVVVAECGKEQVEGSAESWG